MRRKEPDDSQPLTRRDFLKAAGFAGLGALLASCAPLGNLAESAVEGDGLRYGDNPFFDNEHIEQHILLKNIKETRIGPKDVSGVQTMRLLEMENTKFNRDMIPETSGTKSETYRKATRISKALGADVSSIMMLQNYDTWTGQWQTISLPATMETIDLYKSIDAKLSRYYPSSISDNQLAVRAKINSAMHPELTTDERAMQIIQEVISGDQALGAEIMDVRKRAVPLPEDLTPDAVAALYLTELFPMPEENFRTLKEYTSKSGLLDKAIFVPNKQVPEKLLKRIKAWKETFIPLEQEPEVWMVTRMNNFKGVNETRVFVRHKDENGNPEEINGLFDDNGTYGTVTDDALSQFLGRGILSGIDPSGAEAAELYEYFKNSDGSFVYSDPISIVKVMPGMLDVFMVPNKFIGLNSARAAHGLQFVYYGEEDTERTNPLEAVMLFSAKKRDMWFKLQMIDQPFDNWLTKRNDQLKNLISLGVKQIDKWGGRSPLRSMAWMMQGYNDGLHNYQAIEPRSSYLRGCLDNMLYNIITTDYFDKQLNLAVCMEDNVPVHYLRVTKVAGWIEATGNAIEGASDWLQLHVLKRDAQANIAALSSQMEDVIATEVDGTPVMLNQGAVMPMGRTFATPDGKLWVALGDIARDEDGYGIDKEKMFAGFQRFGNGLKNWAVIDDYEGLAIPYEEARKYLMPLDPDPNLWEAIKLVAVVTAVVVAILAPELAGLVVTEIASLPIGILQTLWAGGGLAGVLDFIGAAGSTIVGATMRSIPAIFMGARPNLREPDLA